MTDRLRNLHLDHTKRGDKFLDSCQVCLGGENFSRGLIKGENYGYENLTPIIDRTDEETMVISHHEGKEVKTHVEKAIVKAH